MFIFKYFKRIFRYKVSGICFLCGMISSFLSMYFSIANQRELYNAKKELQEYDCDYQALFEITIDGKDVVFPNYKQGNCLINRLPVMVDTEGKIILCNIYAYFNEAIELPMCSGMWPSFDVLESNDRVAVVGKNYSGNAICINGKDYISINGELYFVSGYLEGNISTEFDNYIVLFFDSLGENVKSQLYSNVNDIPNILSVSLESNYYDVTQLNELFLKDMSKYGSCVQVNNSPDIYERQSVFKEQTYFWIFLYCMCNCIVISFFWYIERKKELCIRNAFGYGTKDIIGVLIKDFCCLFVLGMLIAGIIAVFIQRSIASGIVNASNFIKNMGVTAMLVVVTSALSVFVPVYCLQSKLPVSEITKKEV